LFQKQAGSRVLAIDNRACCAGSHFSEAVGTRRKTLTRKDDPFFSLAGNPEWNAFIDPQASGMNYVDGYVEAPVELASAVIEKKMVAQRDTLIMPILYTARHAPNAESQQVVPGEAESADKSICYWL
jgi:hypothetical protein